MPNQWTSTTIESDADLTKIQDALGYPDAVYYEGKLWLVVSNNQGDELWFRAPDEDEYAAGRREVHMNAEDAKYPFIYIHPEIVSA